MKTSLKDNNMSMCLEIQVDNNKPKALQKNFFYKASEILYRGLPQKIMVINNIKSFIYFH